MSGAARVDPRRVAHLRARAVERLRGRVPTHAELAEAVELELERDGASLDSRSRRATVEAVLDEAFGLGPLEPVLRDRSITELVVNGAGSAFVERSGVLEPISLGLIDDDHLRRIVDRILAPLGRRVDASSPMVDARLADGSRINAVVPPLALDGPCLSVRRFPERTLDLDDLRSLGTVDERTATLLTDAVQAGDNLLVSGGTGSGKTTTLAALAARIPTAERVITIEDAAELRIDHPHVVRLESRPPALHGGGEVTVRDLVRNALRMRPDRLIVGEVRGVECIDMLAAMTTGHAGSMSTLHASGPADALRRLQLLSAMSGLDVAFEAIADQVAAAIDLIVHQVRLGDGRRRVATVERVGRGEPDRWTCRVLVRWRAEDDRFEHLAP